VTGEISCSFPTHFFQTSQLFSPDPPQFPSSANRAHLPLFPFRLTGRQRPRGGALLFAILFSPFSFLARTVWFFFPFSASTTASVLSSPCKSCWVLPIRLPQILIPNVDRIFPLVFFYPQNLRSGPCPENFSWLSAQAPLFPFPL